MFRLAHGDFTLAEFKMKRRFSYAIVAILVVAVLYALIPNNKEPPRFVEADVKGPPESPLSENNGQRKSLHEIYDGVQTLLIFIGYPRSGHTLVSSLLDAHPHVIVANEFDIIGKWKMWDAANRSKYFLFDQLFMNSKQEADVGYRSATVQHRYTYHVPGQWQGTYNMNILVMGAKKGGRTTRLLFETENQKALREIRDVLKLPIKYIHVIRNPYDNIATMLLRALKKRKDADTGAKINSTHHLDEQISKYFKLVQLNSKLNLLFNGSVHLIHSSQLIHDSRNTLRGVCEFLQVGCDEQYIEDCSRIIYREGTKTRHFVVWTEEQKKLVREKLQNFPFLKDYDFDT